VRATRLAAAAAALALAALLALLAADVRTWRATFQADDLRFRAAEGASPDWRATTLLPARLSRGLLGVDDDRALRQAVAAFRTARGARSGFVRRHARGEAEAALSAVAADDGSRRQASQASDLLGVLAFADATTGRRSATPVERSVAAFRNAVRLDQGNEAAKYNLELLLRLLEARGQRIGPNPAPGPRAGGQRGAGAGRPGRGY
jgi:hypothetical protein